jgi:hypothetical protein
MTIWILALVLMAITVSTGYVQGAIRTGFSLLGMIVGMLLAVQLAPIFEPVLPFFGITNEWTKAVVAPVCGFFMVEIAFLIAGAVVHRKIDYHFKYRMTDAQRTLWDRMNRRVGSALASIGGLIYLLLISIILSVTGYATIQLGAAESSSSMLHFLNRMAEDLRTTHMDKVVGGLNPAPASYFETCDFLGFLVQNRDVFKRMPAYPPIFAQGKTHFLDRDPAKGAPTTLQKLVADKEYWKLLTVEKDPSAIIEHQHTQEMLTNSEVRGFVKNLDLKDLETFLKTGKSPKYSEEKILGQWVFNWPASFALARADQPAVLPNDLMMYRRDIPGRFESATLIAASDGVFSIKLPPKVENTPPPNNTGGMPRVPYTGTWKRVGDNYEFSMHKLSDPKPLETSEVRIQQVTARSSRGEVPVLQLFFKFNGWMICFDKVPD